MSDYTVQIVTDYVQPTTEIADNEGYVDMVMNMAALSYMAQYAVATPDEGITAARAAYNAGLPVVAE
jgi:hypothetical protein